MSQVKATPKELIEKIESHVRPATFPVAVRLLGSDEPIPDKARRPQRDLGVQITTCQGVTMARRYGWTVALTRDDINCPLTKVAFGLETEPSYFTDGYCCAGMYASTPAAGSKTEAQTHHLPKMLCRIRSRLPKKLPGRHQCLAIHQRVPHASVRQLRSTCWDYEA